MRFFAGLLAAMLLLAGAETGHGTVRIVRDPGGPIRPYVDRYDHLRASGQNVIIDGLCASACTIVLGKISHDRICVTSQAKLAFHAAWDFGARGLSITNRQATQMLYSMYPSPIRQWIDSRGGLRPRAIFLQGKQLNAMYRLCQVNGQRTDFKKAESARHTSTEGATQTAMHHKQPPQRRQMMSLNSETYGPR